MPLDSIALILSINSKFKHIFQRKLKQLFHTNYFLFDLTESKFEKYLRYTHWVAKI